MTLADRSGLPDGYTTCAIGGTLVVARADQQQAICTALGMGTLHAWASAQPGARAMQGRGVAWATKLPDGPEIVVRHSRHGGMLAAITRDLFLAPTRAPKELDIAVRLRRAGVATPDVIAYAVYSVAGPLCRADVVTAMVEGVELPTALRENRSHQDRHDIRVAVSRMLEALWEAGAHHPDLNARNVLVARPFSQRKAFVLDVDRVTFGHPRDLRMRVMMQNGIRLGRSLMKLREELGDGLSPNEIGAMSQFSPPGAKVTFESSKP